MAQVVVPPIQAPRRSISKYLVAAGVVLAVGAIAVTKQIENRQREAATNFEIDYTAPADWKRMATGPQTLFLFRHPQTNLLIRGAVNRIVSDTNPTPDLHAANLAQFYVDRTKENMPEWTAARMGTVPAKGVQFNLIDRKKKGKRVVSAFAVRGNTTLVVSLSGNEKEVAMMDKVLPDFEKFLGEFSLERVQVWDTDPDKP